MPFVQISTSTPGSDQHRLDGDFRKSDLGSSRRSPYPIPSLDLQRRFAAIVESVEQQKASQRTHMAELDTLFASLQARAFRGAPLITLWTVSENFAFLKQEFPHAAESASFAERHVFGDPLASCFHARHALERLLKRVYKVEKALKPPKVTNLDGLHQRPRLPRTRAQGRMAEGRIHPAGWQRGGPRQQVAGTGDRRWMSCGSCITSSTGRVAPTCARARRV